MPSEKVLLYTSKTLKNGKHPIMLRIIKNRKPRYITIGSCKKELWDFKNNVPSKKHPDQKGLSAKIRSKLHSATSLMFRLEDSKKQYTADDIISNIAEKKESNITVSKYFDNTVKRLISENRLGYAAIFKATKSRILLNPPDHKKCFSDIDEKFLRKVEKHHNNAIMQNSTFVYLRTFKTLISYAKKDGLVAEEYHPFKNISFKKYRAIKTKKRAILKSDIQKFVDYKAVIGSSLFHSRNYFLFSYYNRGINFVDIANLKWKDIINGRLLYNRQKIHKDLDIKLLKPAVEILEYYKQHYNSTSKDYIFPIINPDYVKPISIRNRIKKMLTKTNTDLNVIAKEIGIEGNITTYVARHSFADVLRKQGETVSVISELLAHGDEKITQVYLDGIGTDKLDTAAEAIL